MSIKFSLCIVLLANIIQLVRNDETLPKKEFCRLPSVSGMCAAHFPKYFFNDETKKCEEFVYGGCGGNENRFATELECKRVCIEGRECTQPNNPVPPPGCRYDAEKDGEGCKKNTVICDVKPGKCPTEYASHCTTDCSYSDSVCAGDKKCCAIGCSTVCVSPVAEN